MRKVFDYVLRNQVTLTVAAYALLAKLLLSQDATGSVLAALFLTLVSQLGHKALNYYPAVRKAVEKVADEHGEQLATAGRALAEHTTKLDTAEKNIARISQRIERSGLGI